jgi:hypothetical protein
VPLVLIAFWIGLYPKPLFQILSTPINNLVATVRPDYPGLNKPVLATQPAKTAEPETTGGRHSPEVGGEGLSKASGETPGTTSEIRDTRVIAQRRADGPRGQ